MRRLKNSIAQVFGVMLYRVLGMLEFVRADLAATYCIVILIIYTLSIHQGVFALFHMDVSFIAIIVLNETLSLATGTTVSITLHTYEISFNFFVFVVFQRTSVFEFEI